MPQQYKLLIIDDQPESVRLLLSYLHQPDFDIAVALDGEDGIAKARMTKPDIVLLDIVMPHMNGFEVCKALKADPLTRHIPVIFLSGINDVSEKLAGFAAGGADYITKPFVVEEVLARIYVQLQSVKQIARLESMVAKQVVASLNEDADREHQLFTNARAMLELQAAAPPTLQELARRVGTNERKLTEIFRKKVGMTVFEYLTEMRMVSSRILLDKPGLPIKIIADMVGYRNAGDFSRAFRQRYNLTPREYRQARQVETSLQED